MHLVQSKLFTEIRKFQREKTMPSIMKYAYLEFPGRIYKKKLVPQDTLKDGKQTSMKDFEKIDLIMNYYHL